MGFPLKPSDLQLKAWKIRVVTRTQEFNKALMEVSAHSDKELALVACSILEELSKEILKSHMMELSKTQDKNLFNGTGAMATFSARIAIAYSFGIIPKVVRDDLDGIRNIRNCFAHYFDYSSFNDEIIQAQCQSLKVITPHSLVLISKELGSIELKEEKLSKIGFYLEDSVGNLLLWTAPYLKPDEPKSRFVNSVKSMYMALNLILFARYHPCWAG